LGVPFIKFEANASFLLLLPPANDEFGILSLDKIPQLACGIHFCTLEFHILAYKNCRICLGVPFIKFEANASFLLLLPPANDEFGILSLDKIPQLACGIHFCTLEFHILAYKNCRICLGVPFLKTAVCRFFLFFNPLQISN